MGESLGLGPADTIPATGQTVAQQDQEVLAAKAWTTVMSRVGLGLVAIGFVLQIVAAIPEEMIGWQLVLVRTRRTEMDP
jgi:hypothetical protein